ncbi:hypothetical protein HMPREF9332_01266 [Alloprevotella rava F0323]|uniref:CobW C-terminal domain-containing protein n=1 Tax=Alloprevotella rava F0323 TaxID=679199 RepID=G5GCI9_9BACT|nr:GTP-binding protein [Alloprevotella rava]EHG22768.1 hypothetical protein HMPREF9332_01266 [Alloprevotella rava F0323]
MIEQTPVLLLTGYLGSGKTTLVNRILTNSSGIKFAVIVNDIGEVNIDANLIEKGGIVGKKDDSLVALQNGCICCTLKTDLVEQVHDITSLKKFDYIVIEASGVCEPAPIAQTLCSIPTMYPGMAKDGIARLDCIATVVDALRLRDEFNSGEDLQRKDIGEEDIANLVIQQVEFCNMILLNKASEVKPEELAKIKEILRALQPKAEIIECDYGNVALDKLLNTQLFNFKTEASSATWLAELEKPQEEHHEEEEEHEHHHHEHEHHHDHCHHHHHHHDHEGGETEEYGIGTYVYYRRQPFELSLFDDFVARHWPKGIIRTKGLCWFRDERNTCYVFEQAGKQIGLSSIGQWYATMPEDELRDMMAREPGLRRDWDEKYGDRMQKIVFIGQHLDREEIDRLLDKCLVKE